jgi:hypothetical protein
LAARLAPVPVAVLAHDSTHIDPTIDWLAVQ